MRLRSDFVPPLLDGFYPSVSVGRTTRGSPQILPTSPRLCGSPNRPTIRRTIPLPRIPTPFHEFAQTAYSAVSQIGNFEGPRAFFKNCFSPYFSRAIVAKEVCKVKLIYSVLQTKSNIIPRYSCIKDESKGVSTVR